ISTWGATIAHIGMAVTITGITLTSVYSLEKDVRLVPGESYQLGDYSFKLIGVKEVRRDNYIAYQGSVEATEAGQPIALMHPEKRSYNQSSMPMTEAAIDAGVFRDLFVALGEPLGQGSWSLRIYYKPFVRWIWMGALIMAHSDDKGLVLPPKLAPVKVVIVPIYKNEQQLEIIRKKVSEITDRLKDKNISFKFDDRTTYRPGHKFAEYELKGVPVRLAIGQRDIDNGTIELARRDTLEKKIYDIAGIEVVIENLLNDIQDNIYRKALKFRNENTYKVDTYEEFKDIIKNKGGFVMAHWDGTPETEAKIQEETKATIRNIPFDAPEEDGKCIITGKPSKRRVLFAKAY
ncbi:MAG: His/Gly/Thr/Pro-type tRNA ligase C-terminal domain-containing protein, partial [Campylobacteraceae bacterium]|nr:His/Gly/Thr/Pro-type tRNA ligase C-terminal domain-containing protein [Campylobacteraceae bacterium]